MAVTGLPMAPSEIPPNLLTAYLTTDYRVFGDEDGFTLRIGQHSLALAELFQKAHMFEAVFITAENPFSKATSETDNAERLEQLRNELAAISPAVFPGEGQGLDPSWPAEKSFLALGVALDQARALGEKYQQNAIVWVGEDAIPHFIMLRGRPNSP